MERFSEGVEHQQARLASMEGDEGLNAREVNVLASLRDLFSLSVIEEVCYSEK